MNTSMNPFQVAEDGPLLLRQMQSPADGNLYLLQRGATRVVVDVATRSLALPTALSLSEIVPLLDDPAWFLVPLDAETFLHQYVYLLPRRHSFEALYFCIARHRPQLLPTPAPGVSLQLQHWPDLDHRDVPASWLLPIARLYAGPWTSSALAAACAMPHETIEFLFSAAASAGLAGQQENVVATPARPASHRDAHFPSWAARRFGLDLQAGRVSSAANTLVFVSGKGAGTTSAVRAISDAEPVSTDTELDYSAIELDDGELLHLYGVPARCRLDSRQPAACEAAFGVIVLVSAATPDPAASMLELLLAFSKTAPDATLAVGITHTDEHPQLLVPAVRDALSVAGFRVPVLRVDARSATQVTFLVRSLLAHRYADEA